MWVPATRKEWLVGALAALLALSAFVTYGYIEGRLTGRNEGIDMYHDMCYTVGGYVVDEQGRVVACSGLTQIPQQELPLDRKKTI